jgi:hypothetical protein
MSLRGRNHSFKKEKGPHTQKRRIVLRHCLRAWLPAVARKETT